MKKILLIITAFLSIINSILSQSVNWRAFGENEKHLTHVQAGWDYGLSYGLGYGYKFNTKMPILANIEYSFPSGQTLFDDFKTKVGGQMEVLKVNGFSTTLKVYCPIRRFENPQARLFNFGAEFTAVAGYYKPKWYVSGEFGFDKAIITHIKHGAVALEENPTLQKGWFIPTGGNFNYGIQTGFSFMKNDITFKIGKLLNQYSRTTPLIPYYTQLGYNRRF
jgi:hypothetical protein